MGGTNKETRKLIFNTLRKIEGHVDRMCEQLNWLVEEVNHANSGMHKTGIMLQMMHSMVVILRETIINEYRRPGYKKLVADEFKKIQDGSVKP